MKIRIITLSTAVALIVVCASQGARAQEALASAKSLYESASYEAALSELNQIQNSELADTVDTYKALCLLGLGRTRDAEQALEAVVIRKPLLVLDDDEYSPRVIALFRDVRKKALPAAAQQLYLNARSDYENKKYDVAATGFKQALQVIADIAPESQTQTIADLKELSSGFATLAEAKVGTQPPARAAAAPQPSVPSAPALSTPAPSTPAPSTSAPSIPAPSTSAQSTSAPSTPAARFVPGFYTLADIDVTPPVIVAQQIPPWTFTAHAPNRVFTGTLELVIDEKGSVEAAKLTDPIWPPYDLALLQAAKLWRYQPAVRQGKPVKFKRILVINMDPSTQRPR